MNKIDLVRTSQPQVPVEIDWSNPLTLGLIRALVPIGLNYKDTVTGGWAYTKNTTGLTINATVDGVGRRTNSFILNQVTTVPSRSETGTSVGVIWRGVIHASGGVSFPILRNSQYVISLSTATSPAYTIRAGEALNIIGTKQAIIGKPTSLALMRTGNTFTFTIDDSIELSGVLSGSSLGGLWTIDSNSGFSQSNDITTELVLIFNKLTPQQAIALSANPWQIFKPIQKQIFVPQPIAQESYKVGNALSMTSYRKAMQKGWTSQPQQACEIDWGNPITRGLVGHWTPAYKSAGSAPVAANSIGVGISTNGSSEYKSVPVNGTITNAITVFSVVDMNMRASAFERICAVIHSGSSSGLQFYEPGAGLVQVFARDSANNNVYANFTLPRKTGILSIVGRSGYTSATSDCFINGVKLSQSASSSNGNGTVQSGTTEFRIGSHKEDGAFYYGRHKCINISAAWNRLLSDTEITALSGNPWQIFKPLANKAPITLPQYQVVTPEIVAGLIISMTSANALATGLQAQILYDQLIQMLSASATTPSKTFNIDKTLDLLRANAQATGIPFNTDIAMLLSMAVANAQASGIKANIDKAINIQSGNSIASGGNILLDKAINLAFANSNASGVKLNIDKTIDTTVANAQASGVTTLIDIVKNLLVANAVANSNGFGSGSVLNLNSISGLATGTKAALDKVINQVVANASANAPKFNLDKSVNAIVVNALATGIITHLDKQILTNSANAIATGITTILEYAVALAMNSGLAAGTGTSIRIDKQVLISAGIANASGINVSVVFGTTTYEPAFIVFSSTTSLVVLDVVHNNAIVAPNQVLQILSPASRSNDFTSGSTTNTSIVAPNQVLQILSPASRSNDFTSGSRTNTFNR